MLTNTTELFSEYSNNSCLLLIDVQEAFITDETAETLSNIYGLLQGVDFNKIVATQFINTADSIYVEELDYRGCLTPNDIRLDATVKEVADRVIQKQGYTAASTVLSNFFREYGIDTVYLAGFNTDACVLSTVMDLFGKGIHCIVIEDCCASTGGTQLHNNAIDIMKYNIGKQNIVKMNDL
jgi:nicotinamidase-related amidase